MICHFIHTKFEPQKNYWCSKMLSQRSGKTKTEIPTEIQIPTQLVLAQEELQLVQIQTMAIPNHHPTMAMAMTTTPQQHSPNNNAKAGSSSSSSMLSSRKSILLLHTNNSKNDNNNNNNNETAEQKKKKTVAFNNRVWVHVVENLRTDLSKKRKQLLWYSQIELWDIQLEWKREFVRTHMESMLRRQRRRRMTPRKGQQQQKEQQYTSSSNSSSSRGSWGSTRNKDCELPTAQNKIPVWLEWQWYNCKFLKIIFKQYGTSRIPS